MSSLVWSTSHAVFVTEIDDDHKEIFAAISRFQELLASGAPAGKLHELAERLMSGLAEHFAHEERLMRAARYGSMRWHQRSHRAAGRRVGEFVARLEQGELAAARELVEYLESWLPDHASVADRMMGAALRNQQRCMWTMTFRAGTKPADACAWVDTKGEAFDPSNDRRQR
jgi:hemerythrin